MKQIHYLWTLVMGGMLSLTSCSDDDDPGKNPSASDVPEAVLNAFNQKYPQARNVEWSKTDAYAIAKFYDTATRSDDHNHTAWFALADASWGMTEQEITFSQLPAAVLEAFNASSYAVAPWIKERDDIDVLVRPDAETLYVIEVEKEENKVETEVDLYYTETGLLVKEIVDAENDKDYHEFLPQTPESSVTAWLETNFPDGRIIDIEKEDGGTEVELVGADGWKREIMFNASSAWMYTKTDFSAKYLNQLPQAVLATLQASALYNGRNVDDIDYYETAAGDKFYVIELEQRDDDVELYIAADGQLLQNRPEFGDDGQGVPVVDDVHTFISETYQGAVILEKDYDDGYLEVEIRHEGLEKEVVFNGKNEWIRTTWEVRTLPELLSNALTEAGYNVQSVDDDIEVIHTAGGYTYKVEIRKGNREYEVTLNDKGEILSERADD
ncbi:MAG: PepSY-like domain-containing protein [Phocaeicola sp.]|nr:PepSY-like domain-containing protein [Phocaeicola sp.]